MSEFTKKLNSSELVSNAWDEIDKGQADAGLLFNTISNEFKDWQPPKPLVAVPQLVADYIETQKGNDFDRVGTLVCGHFGTLVYGHHAADDRSEKHSELHKWITDNFDTFLEAIVNGYTVEKEKIYTLKHIDLSGQYKNESFYLAHSRYAKLKHVSFLKDVDMSEIEQCHFTQEEIDKLNIGSYEQKEVEP